MVRVSSAVAAHLACGAAYVTPKAKTAAKTPRQDTGDMDTRAPPYTKEQWEGKRRFETIALAETLTRDWRPRPSAGAIGRRWPAFPVLWKILAGM
jgi:hypothetical protein|tara:strand:+ start:3128 stop:3412 length:285 start_codon:yes stop_codon:yes gene_type:complete